MIEFARAAPPYSIVAVEDSSGGLPPELTGDSRLVANDSCIAVGTQYEADGETEFRLGNRGEVDPGRPPNLQGRLKTPSRIVVIRTVLGDTISQMPVLRTETTISIWVNHPTAPDLVIIGLE